MTRLLKWSWAWELDEDNWSWRRLIIGDCWVIYMWWDLLHLQQNKVHHQSSFLTERWLWWPRERLTRVHSLGSVPKPPIVWLAADEIANLPYQAPSSRKVGCAPCSLFYLFPWPHDGLANMEWIITERVREPFSLPYAQTIGLQSEYVFSEIPTSGSLDSAQYNNLGNVGGISHQNYSGSSGRKVLKTLTPLIFMHLC